MCAHCKTCVKTKISASKHVHENHRVRYKLRGDVAACSIAVVVALEEADVKPTVFLTLLMLTMAAPASAWSTKEHILLTRLAAERLIADPSTPPAMREWLRKGLRGQRSLVDEKEFLLHQRIGTEPRGADGFAFWAVMPDLQAALSGSGDREAKVQPFGVSERLLHYVDVEFFYPDANQRNYVDDLSHKRGIL